MSDQSSKCSLLTLAFCAILFSSLPSRSAGQSGTGTVTFSPTSIEYSGYGDYEVVKLRLKNTEPIDDIEITTKFYLGYLQYPTNPNPTAIGVAATAGCSVSYTRISGQNLTVGLTCNDAIPATSTPQDIIQLTAATYNIGYELHFGGCSSGDLLSCSVTSQYIYLHL
jgi:hypothetical protein